MLLRRDGGAVARMHSIASVQGCSPGSSTRAGGALRSAPKPRSIPIKFSVNRATLASGWLLRGGGALPGMVRSAEMLVHGGVRGISSTHPVGAKKNRDDDGESEVTIDIADVLPEGGSSRKASIDNEVVVLRDRSGLGDNSQVVAQDPNWVPKEVIVIPVFRRPIFPGIATPIALTNPELCDAISKLKNEHGANLYVGLFLAKDQEADERRPITSVDQIHEIGCLGHVVHMNGIQSMGIQLLVAGSGRILITGAAKKSPFLTVKISRTQDKPFDPNDKIIKAYMLEILATVKSIVKLEHFFKEQLQTILTQVNVQNPAHLADITTSMTTADRNSLQSVLETLDVQDRLSQALRLLKIELEQAELQKTIHKQMEEHVSKIQRKHFLTEQLKIIKKELGMEVDEKEELTETMNKKFKDLKAPPAAAKVIEEQLKKISSLDPASPEYNTTRSYLDWLLAIPWGVHSKDSLDVGEAKKVLDTDHHGMKDVKDRILEFIAVGVLKGNVEGKILCFNGPPGVGKTSIGKSIASALGRKFFRFSVGGMTDVSEIKGHRRTYVGAMPGKIIQALKQAGTANPVIMLDEIDKLGRGYQGDPASALLEVLDPSQNKDFLDHYMDVHVDLSRVLFIATSNGRPPPTSKGRPRSGALRGGVGLPDRCTRPVTRPRHDPRPAARPHGDHRGLGVHRGGQGENRQEPPPPKGVRRGGPQGLARLRLGRGAACAYQQVLP